MKRARRFALPLALLIAVCQLSRGDDAADKQAWNDPPPQARLRAYWWWLNSNVTKESITRDLEQMKAKGFGGAVLMDAGGAEQDGNAQVPAGPTFFSDPWRELFKHTLREADRLGLEISLNIQSGWNLGGPIVKPEDAAKKLVFTQTQITGPAAGPIDLPKPKGRDNWYRDLYVVAYPVKSDAKPNPAGSLKNWPEKAVYKSLNFSAPDTSMLLEENPAAETDENIPTKDVLDLTAHFDAASGKLDWNAPAGNWEVLRLGCTIGDHSYVSTNSAGWKGYALDVMDEGAFRRYWDAVVEPLLIDAGPLAGKSLRYLHTDSWEVEAINWTPTLADEFRQRRGYDLTPWLPVMAGRIVNDRDQSNRFLYDYRRTLGDLAIDHHYKPFREWAAKYHLGMHPESGGPHASPIDAQQCLGMDDAPMSEFWAESWRHRIGDPNRFFVKQPASAAHTYGHPLVMAEGFTTIGPHWQETLWDNLKPSFDHASSEGMNRLVWHAFVCSPESAGVPGQQYFAGTHLNPLVTWWDKSAPFFLYLNRCQWMLQRGNFVADALYYYGDDVPNFSQLRASDPAKVGIGYDYDVISADAIISRLSVKDGRLTLPDGMSYRVLVLPPFKAISLPVLRKLEQLVNDGATVIGPMPDFATGMTDFPKSDTEVRAIADRLWNGKTGAGRVIADKTAREVLQADGIGQDLQFTGGGEKTAIDYIHRRDGDADIYFIANRSRTPENLQFAFRVAGKAPQLWDAVTGDVHWAADYQSDDKTTTVPLTLGPFGSLFVVFKEPTSAHPATGKPNQPEATPAFTLDGPWKVEFDTKWGGPAEAEFPELVSWTTREEPGIKYYSGTTKYHHQLDLPTNLARQSLALDLGNVRELAEVLLNGKSLGIVWAPPFRVDLPKEMPATGNELEIQVVNFWPNRIIGDANLPAGERLTKTNVRQLKKDTKLIDSGLMGPVQIMIKPQE
jgi:(4-O-methyl)-D-glucuronate---lignin esterase